MINGQNQLILPFEAFHGFIIYLFFSFVNHEFFANGYIIIYFVVRYVIKWRYPLE